jgi:hypothetical protein
LESFSEDESVDKPDLNESEKVNYSDYTPPSTSKFRKLAEEIIDLRLKDGTQFSLDEMVGKS